MSKTPDLRINAERLWSRIMEIAKYGATPAGGCNRQALTDEDRAGRDLFIEWCKDAGCEIRIDRIGNIFARRPGTEELPPVMTGSHLDTQPSGGKYDGIYGVLSGLESIESMNDAGIRTKHPIDIVVWTNEEGSRFDAAMMGSAVWAGAMPIADAYALADREGATVESELNRIGYMGDIDASPVPIHAAFELHIEQGPILEAEDEQVGVVTGVQHMSRHRVLVHGQEAHAGPTPMPMRRDPMMALAAFLPRLYGVAEAHAPDGRITFGYVHADPGSPNTVPGRLELTIDIRHPDDAHYHAMVSEAHEIVKAGCDKFGLDASVECYWEAPGVTFAPECVSAVSDAVKSLGYTHRSMVSGAGHDACNLAAVAPTSMIFIPCEGGLSHNEAESITREQSAVGANVLLHALLHRAEVVA